MQTPPNAELFSPRCCTPRDAAQRLWASPAASHHSSENETCGQLGNSVCLQGLAFHANLLIIWFAYLQLTCWQSLETTWILRCQKAALVAEAIAAASGNDLHSLPPHAAGSLARLEVRGWVIWKESGAPASLTSPPAYCRGSRLEGFKCDGSGGAALQAPSPACSTLGCTVPGSAVPDLFWSEAWKRNVLNLRLSMV